MSLSDDSNVASINFENNTENIYEGDTFIIIIVTCASVLVVVTFCIVLCCVAAAWLNKGKNTRNRRGSGGFYRLLKRPTEETVVNNNPLPLVPSEPQINLPQYNDLYEIPRIPFWVGVREEIDKLPPAPPVFPRELMGLTEDRDIAATHSSRNHEVPACESMIDDYLEGSTFSRNSKKQRSAKKESSPRQNVSVNTSRRVRSKSRRRHGMPTREESSDSDDPYEVPRGKRSTIKRLDMSEIESGGRRSDIQRETSYTSSGTNEVSEEHTAEEGSSRSIYRSELHIQLSSSPKQSRSSRNSSIAPAVVVHVHINEKDKRKSSNKNFST